MRIETGIDLSELAEAADEKARSQREHHRQRDLAHHEELGPAAHSAGVTAPALHT